MKTESSLGTRSPVSSGKSVLEQLSASRTPAKAGRDAASSLSFRTLMADIRPGGFEEMTQRMAERRAEHQRPRRCGRCRQKCRHSRSDQSQALTIRFRGKGCCFRTADGSRRQSGIRWRQQAGGTIHDGCLRKTFGCIVHG